MLNYLGVSCAFEFYMIPQHWVASGSWKLNSNKTIFIFDFIFSIMVVENQGHLNIKMSSYQYNDTHVKDKVVSRPSYL